MRKLYNWELDNYKNNMTNIPRGTMQYVFYELSLQENPADSIIGNLNFLDITIIQTVC